MSLSNLSQDQGTRLVSQPTLPGSVGSGVDLNRPLKLRPGVKIVGSEDAIYVGRGAIEAHWVRLSGKGIRQLLQLLDGRLNLESLLGAVPESGRAALKALLEELRQAELLEPWADGRVAHATVIGQTADTLKRAAEHGPTIRALDSLAKRRNLGGFHGLALFESLRLSKVGLVADPALEAPVMEALRGYGIEDCRKDTLGSSTPDLDLVLVIATAATADTVFGRFARDIRFPQDSAADQRPWLPVLVEGLDCRLGPLFMPEQGPCYHCYRHRRDANLSTPARVDAVAIHPEMNDVPTPGSIRLCAELVALEVVLTLVARSQGKTPELQGRVKDISLPDCSTVIHTLLPLPFCPSCKCESKAGLDVQPDRPTPPAVPGKDVFDPLCGIVKTCLSMPVATDDPQVFFVATEATDSTRFGTGIPEASRFGCGVDLHEEAAKGAAMGEILERYSAAHYDPSLLRYCSFDQLEDEATRPDSFALFSADQYDRFSGPPHPFTNDTETGWVRGHSLVDERPIWVPAPFVYLPYRYGAGETYLGDCLSTGLSCGLTRDAAILNSLSEVVERDTTSITWYARLAPTRLTLDPGSRLEDLYRNKLSTPDMELRLLDLTLDVGIPTIAAFLLHQAGGTVVGSATRLNPTEAARKAVLEAVQGQLVWKEWLRDGPKRRFASDFHDVVDYADHPRVYMDAEMRPRLDFLWSSPVQRSVEQIATLQGACVSSPEEQLSVCVNALVAAGLEPIVVDVTSPDVRQLGYWVTRVLVPGLQPLNARHDSPYFGGSRLYQVPQRLGLQSHRLTEGDLNSDPHPFP